MLVNLKKRVKTKGRWTYAAVPRKNGRFMPERLTEPGTFYIEWRVDGRRHQERVGPNARNALEALRVKQQVLNEGANKPFADEERGKSFKEACESYLNEVKATKSAGTHRQYAAQTKWLVQSIEKTFAREVTRDDIMALFAKGREQGLHQKTINLRIIVALAVIRSVGNDLKLKRGDWPKTADREVEVYDYDQLRRFFAACDEIDELADHLKM